MNIFKSLFGIFRKGGLVATIKKGESIKGFALSALLTAILGSLLYGFSMGIGFGLDTAIKDAIKVGLISIMVLLFSVPVFWISFRLLGREESMGHVNAVPLTMLSTVTLILAISSPIVFLLSVLVTASDSAIYIHIIIINLAILVGIYITGTLIYHTFEEHKRLVTPALISIAMMGVILVVGIMFFSPFLRPSSTFSDSTERLKDGIGLGVDLKVLQGLSAAADAESLSYHYLRTNNNGDTIQDYFVTRVGDDYLIEVNIHTVAGDPEQHNSMIWVLDGETYTDFNNNAVDYAAPDDLKAYASASSPEEIFVLPPKFENANWRGYPQNNKYIAVATTPNLETATFFMDADGRLSSLIIGSSEDATHAKIEISNIIKAKLSKNDIENSLLSAIKIATFIDVPQQVNLSLIAAISSKQVTYQFQTSYDNGELIQDYTVTRVGENYWIQIHLHGIPGEILMEDQNIWILDGVHYTDFNNGEVRSASPDDLSNYLESSLPTAAFTLASEFSNTVWQASEKGSLYNVSGIAKSGSTASLTIDSESGRLSELSVVNAQNTVPAIITVKNVAPITMDRTALQASLNEAIIIGLANNSVPSMDDYVKANYNFLLRHPNTWNAGAWNSAEKRVLFSQDYPVNQESADLTLSVHQLTPNQTLLETAENLASNYGLQPEFRNISSATVIINEAESGVVEYLFDEVEDGNLITTQHIVYIFNGEFYQYQLDFNALSNDFNQLDELFQHMASLFTYIEPSE